MSQVSKPCAPPSLLCYQLEGKTGHETVMLSTFPQELIALISWENVLKEKKIVIEDSLERKKKKNLLDSPKNLHLPYHGMQHIP